MTLTLGIAAAAGLAYRSKNGNVDAAAAEFRRLLEAAQLPLPAKPLQYLRTWGPRMDVDGNIVPPESHAGRPRKLTDKQVHTCYAECLNWFKDGRPRPYVSAEELMTTNSVVRDITTAAGVSGETMTRHIREIDPNFQYGKLRNRPYLDKDHKDSRVASCQEKLGTFEQRKPWVVYVDEKVMCLSECCTKGWFSSSAEDYAWSMPRLTRNRKTVKLKYIIGVNYQLGPVWIKFFTGTTGMLWNRDGHAYRVSSCLEQLGGLAGSNMLHCFLQGCCPAHGTAKQGVSSTRMQPQHTETKGQRCLGQCLTLGLPDCQCVPSVVAPAVLCVYVLLPLHLNQQAVWG